MVWYLPGNVCPGGTDSFRLRPPYPDQRGRVSNPEVAGPYWQEPPGTGNGSTDYSGASYGGTRGGGASSSGSRSARDSRSASSGQGRRERGRDEYAPRGDRGDGYSSGSAGRRGGGRDSAPGRPAPGAADADDFWQEPRGRRGRSRPEADPAGSGRRDSRYGARGQADRSPRGSRGYEGSQATGTGQVAQDLRERLGVRGAQGPGRTGGTSAGTSGGRMDDPRGNGASGPRTGTGYTGGRRAARAAAGDGGEGGTGTMQRGRPAGGPGWGEPGDTTGMPGTRRRPGAGGRGGSGGPGGGPGGPGGRGGGSGPGGRRTFKEWLLYGSWWRHWTWKKAAAVVGGTVVGIVVLVIAGFFVVYTRPRSRRTPRGGDRGPLQRLLRQRQADRNLQQRRPEPADPDVRADPAGDEPGDHRGRGPALLLRGRYLAHRASCGPPSPTSRAAATARAAPP